MKNENKTESKFCRLYRKFSIPLWSLVFIAALVGFVGLKVDNMAITMIGTLGDLTLLPLLIFIERHVGDPPEVREAARRREAQKAQEAQMKEELGHYARFSGGTLYLEKRTSLFSKASAFSISADEITPMYYNPERYIYTSATVGGITTGGIDKVGGNYIKKKPVKTGKCELKYFNQTVEAIRLSSKLHAEAKKSPIKKYLNDKGEIVVVKYNVSIAALEIAERVCGPHSEMTQTLLHNGYPTHEKCREIIAWICEEERENTGKSSTSPRP